MNLQKFQNSIKLVHLENQWGRIINALLAIAVILLVLQVRGQEAPVVVIPPGMNEEGQIIATSASESFHKAWSHHLAQTLGNVSPGNSRFVRSVVEPLLGSEIYDETMIIIERQLDAIERDRVAYSFEPREVIFDRETRTTQVVGRHYVHKGAGETERDNRTYEFQWDFVDYRPILRFIDTFEGSPRRR